MCAASFDGCNALCDVGKGIEDLDQVECGVR